MEIHDSVEPVAEVLALKADRPSEKPVFSIDQLPVPTVLDANVEYRVFVEHFRDDAREPFHRGVVSLPQQRAV